MPYYIKNPPQDEDEKEISWTSWYAYENGDLLCRAVSFDSKHGYHWASLDADTGGIQLELATKPLAPEVIIDDIIQGEEWVFVSQKEFETVWEKARHQRPSPTWQSGYPGPENGLDYYVQRNEDDRTILIAYQKNVFDRIIVLSDGSYQTGTRDQLLTVDDFDYVGYTLRDKSYKNSLPPGIYVNRINEGEPWKFISQDDFEKVWKMALNA